MGSETTYLYYYYYKNLTLDEAFMNGRLIIHSN
jgi:hypothetical protein